MSKKPKKIKPKKKNINKSGKRGNNHAKAALAIKGIVARVGRSHGFIHEIAESGEAGTPSEALREYFVTGRDLNGAVPGDTVLFEKTVGRRPQERPHEEQKPEARVIKVLQTSDNLLIG